MIWRKTRTIILQSNRGVGVVCAILVKGDPDCLSETIGHILDCLLIIWYVCKVCQSILSLWRCRSKLGFLCSHWWTQTHTLCPVECCSLHHYQELFYRYQSYNLKEQMRTLSSNLRIQEDSLQKIPPPGLSLGHWY